MINLKDTNFCKPIQGFEKYYYITKTGQVWSVRKNDFLKKSKHKTGYFRVHLVGDNQKKIQYIHRLVAIAFLPNPNNLPQVNHKDENKENNNVNNLEWVTSKENCNWGTRNERIAKPKPVIMCDKDTHKEIKAFSKVIDAYLFLNKPYNSSGIQKVLSGKRKSAYGYYWKR